MRHLSSTKTKQTGTTLIEVLIAVLIVSIGLLGVASMQINTMRSHQAAYERSMSVMFIYAIAERIKANKDELLTYNVNDGLHQNPIAVCQIPAGNTLADTDTHAWITEMQTFLGGQSCGAITCNDVTNTSDITVRWGDVNRLGGFDSNMRISL